jgi:hypothetical protein
MLFSSYDSFLIKLSWFLPFWLISHTHNLSCWTKIIRFSLKNKDVPELQHKSKSYHLTAIFISVFVMLILSTFTIREQIVGTIILICTIVFIGILSLIFLVNFIYSVYSLSSLSFKQKIFAFIFSIFQ